MNRTGRRTRWLGRDFVQTEAAGGMCLVAGAVVALLWANSPWSSSYGDTWSSTLSIGLRGHSIALSLREWVNEGLIAVFFLLAGLEIKREVLGGHLADRRAAFLPALAALGGMVAPALIYLAIAGSTEPRGWAIVVATDIPLAMGVLAIAGARVPGPMRVFLLALAIVDDILSLVIIAVVYSSDLRWSWLAIALGVLTITIVLRRLAARATFVLAISGVALWVCLFDAGVSPTLAGVAIGLLAPVTAGSERVVESLEHALHPWVSYGIVPLFALANTGITFTRDRLGDALHSPITWAIVIGRVIGKPLGIMSVRTIARRSIGGPADTWSRRISTGVAASAGMGFTVALFITELAIHDETLRWNATLGIVLAAVVSGGASLAILRARPRRPA